MDASVASDARLQHQAATKALLQQSVKVVGIDPEDLFEGLAQRVENKIRGEYEQKLEDQTRKAILAEV